MLLSTTTYFPMTESPKKSLLKGTVTVEAGSDISNTSSCSLQFLFSIGKTLTFQLTAQIINH